MSQQLTRSQLESLLKCEHIEALSDDQIADLIRNEANLIQYAPDGICQTDPRNGDRIIFSSARARRPHDNENAEIELSHTNAEQSCRICDGLTTGVLDVADLSEGFTFINLNLFPIFYPQPAHSQDDKETASGQAVQGAHFLQWSSSFHERDWHNMPEGDRVIVLQRLAALERKLLEKPGQYVTIIKNYGHLVGGSLAHGHQQIGVSNVEPNRIRQDREFRETRQETFTAYMLRENPSELLIRDYGPAVLITPYFMRRPYDMQLFVKDNRKSHLFELNAAETRAVAQGWQDAIRVMRSIMPRIGKETAYNVTAHNGDGSGLYFEFLPYTQEMGGFEHLGLYLCQSNPSTAAQQIREVLADYADGEG
ncbi:MAG: UDPglucose--hexose-phosphate uridylyltransferase [Chloroflexota bacterium]|nr:UDPglucose--hexose-phosphate uridylyltransferase [Chloroflexota bacterium]